MTNQQVINALNDLKVEFPHGKFWNHDPSFNYDADNPDHPKMITSSPCDHTNHNHNSMNGSCGCNSFGNAIQCVGFAKYMAYRTFGSYPENVTNVSGNGGDCLNGWRKYTKTNFSQIDLQPGDLIQTETHRAIVYTVNGSNVQVGEVWGNPRNTNYTCMIAWGHFNGNSNNTLTVILDEAKYILKAPKTVIVTYGFRDGNVNPTVTQQALAGTTYGTMPSPVNSNDLGIFMGWWDHPVDQNKEYTEDSVIKIYTDHTLYAHWGFPIKLTNVGANKCLNINGDNLTSLSNSMNVTLWSDSGTNEQRWLVKSVGTQRVVKSVIDPRFGLNVYRSGSPYNCNIYKTCGNETDALVNFISLGNGVMKIKLTNYDLYLTAASTANGANVFWGEASDSDLQKWTFESY